MDFWMTVVASFLGVFLYEFMMGVVKYGRKAEEQMKKRREQKDGTDTRVSAKDFMVKRDTYSPAVSGRREIGFQASMTKNEEDR